MRSGSSSPLSQDRSHSQIEIHRTHGPKGLHEPDHSISCTGIAKNSKQSIDLIPPGIASQTTDTAAKAPRSVKTILVLARTNRHRVWRW